MVVEGRKLAAGIACRRQPATYNTVRKSKTGEGEKKEEKGTADAEEIGFFFAQGEPWYDPWDGSSRVVVVWNEKKEQGGKKGEARACTAAVFVDSELGWSSGPKEDSEGWLG